MSSIRSPCICNVLICWLYSGFVQTEEALYDLKIELLFSGTDINYLIQRRKSNSDSHFLENPKLNDAGWPGACSLMTQLKLCSTSSQAAVKIVTHSRHG